LGSGFAIAMRDLEIRGAGNLLGVKQSGHIAALGFDLYCQLLAEAVEELKAKQAGEAREKVVVGEKKELPSISLPLDAHIPEDYVSNLNTRLSLYDRLAKVEDIEEVAAMAREFLDRFGPLPEPVENLLYIVKTKVLAMQAKVSSISTQGRQIVIKPQSVDSPLNMKGAGRVMSKYLDSVVKIGATQIKLDTRLLGNRWKVVLEQILSSGDVRSLHKR
jgi:transcription-repair coupling factor (superfamily II helicase)